MLAKAFMNVKSRFNLPLWARIRHSPFRSVDASVTLFQVRMTVPAQFHAKKSQDIDHDRTIHKVFFIYSCPALPMAQFDKRQSIARNIADCFHLT